MPYLYGSLPVAFSALKSMTLIHPDFNSGNPGTVTISTSADCLGFETAVSAFHSAIQTATGNDLSLTWSTTTGYVGFSSAGNKTWFVTSWPACGFFGFQFPVDKWRPSGTAPGGALYLEGVSVDEIEPQTITSETGIGENYGLIKGTVLKVTGYYKLMALRGSLNNQKGLGSVLDVLAWMGVVTCQPGSDSSAFSLENLDGKITDAQVIDYQTRGSEAFMSSEIWSIDMRLQL
tara:strand:+ start:850 stop:1548 length:699 start_codon:yes stop_codon:yes gene_type:complete